MSSVILALLLAAALFGGCPRGGCGPASYGGYAYAPPPRYYAPPPRYYAPPPRYYAPPAYHDHDHPRPRRGLSLRLDIGRRR